MKLEVIAHQAAEGGYWAEVSAIPGCATQAETFGELLGNLDEAIEGCLSIGVDGAPDGMASLQDRDVPGEQAHRRGIEAHVADRCGDDHGDV